MFGNYRKCFQNLINTTNVTLHIHPADITGSLSLEYTDVNILFAFKDFEENLSNLL